MTSKDCHVFCFKPGWTLAVSSLGVLISVYMLPSPIDPEPYIFPEKPPPLIGALLPNRRLQNVTKIHLNKVIGPESFAVDKQGWIYTGTATGDIWRFKGNKLEYFVSTGSRNPLCDGTSFDLEPECGRPKGMGVHPDGRYLYVADSYKGLLQVDLITRRVNVILTEINGEKFRFLNGLAISREGTVYFTDSSTKWDRRNHRYEVIETNRLGRLVSYEPASNTSILLRDGLYLANGVALAPDDSYIIISQMSVCKLTRLYLKGQRQGQSEDFHTNLPGYPDNIQLSPRGTFYVGMASARFYGSSSLGSFLDIVGPYPSIKRFIAKVTPFAAYNIFLPKHALLLELNSTGHIIRSFQDPEGSVVTTGASEGFEYDNVLYLGHFSAPYIGKLTLQAESSFS